MIYGTRREKAGYLQTSDNTVHRSMMINIKIKKFFFINIKINIKSFLNIKTKNVKQNFTIRKIYFDGNSKVFNFQLKFFKYWNFLLKMLDKIFSFKLFKIRCV